MVDGSAVHIGIVQARAAVGDVAANLATLERLAGAAARQGAEIVVTPELFSTGYDPATAWQHDGAAVRAHLAGIAGRLGVALVASTIDTDATTEAHRIAASCFDETGAEIARAHKRHLYGPLERQYCTSGLGYAEPFSWRGVPLALGVCYDIEFPEFARAQALRGARIILVPTAVPALETDSQSPAWRYSASLTSTLQVPARALENGVVIAYANHCGEGFTGSSCIATPFGRLAALLGDDEGVAVVEVPLAAIDRARSVNTYLADLP